MSAVNNVYNKQKSRLLKSFFCHKNVGFNTIMKLGQKKLFNESLLKMKNLFYADWENKDEICLVLMILAEREKDIHPFPAGLSLHSALHSQISLRGNYLSGKQIPLWSTGLRL